MNDDKTIEFGGKLWWMPKLETIELIKEFIEDLKNEGATNYDLLKKWKKKLNVKLKYKAEDKVK